MKSVTAAYTAILFGTAPILRADLMTVTLANGTVLRLTSADIDIALAGNTYSHSLVWSRKGTTQSIGTSPDTIDVEMYDNGAFLVAGAPLVNAVSAGLFNNAIVQIDKLVLANWTDVPPGRCGWFYGYVSTSTSIAGVVTLTVKSMLGLLGISMPRVVVQPQCNNGFGDLSCGFNVATVTFPGTCTGGTQLQPTASGLTDGQFNLGKIVFTTGANAGVKRSIKSNAGGVISLAYPLPNVPSVGDSFNISQGCLRTQAACTTYGNTPRFKGMPYIPAASIALEGGTGVAGANADAGSTGGGVSGSSTSAGSGSGTYNN